MAMNILISLSSYICANAVSEKISLVGVFQSQVKSDRQKLTSILD